MLDPVTEEPEAPAKVSPAHERAPVRRFKSTDTAASSGQAAASVQPAVADVSTCSNASYTTGWRQLSARASERRNSSSSQGNISHGYSTPPRSTAAYGHQHGGASTSSTIDTPTKLSPHERSRSAAPTRISGTPERRFDALEAFLASPDAAKFIDRRQLTMMREEIAEAQVREAYWSGLPDTEEDELPFSMQGSVAVPASRGTTLPLTPLGGSSWRVRDHTSTDTSGSGKWAVWTYKGPALHREDFSNEHEAWAALCNQSGAPCVLRDPSGIARISTSWNTSCA